MNRAVATPARIAAIATHLPERVLANDELAEAYPNWSAEKILEKTGIRERRVAAEGETAADLAFTAAVKLLNSGAVDRDEVDFLILCTQAPDYLLPTTACILQHRLGLPTRVGALDINLGCSGYVYGLALAAGLIASGAAATVLLLTADTYSKFIHPLDKSVRTLFGDGAAATLIRAAAAGQAAGERPTIGPFVFGTDGGGAMDLVVEAGGQRVSRNSSTALAVSDRAGNVRSRDNLYMNGGAVLNFSLRVVPAVASELLARTSTTFDDYDGVILHQANKLMLDTLQRKLGVPAAKLPRLYELIGNTVSSTIPFVLAKLIEEGTFSAGKRYMLIGFGVGLSWAAASVQL